MACFSVQYKMLSNMAHNADVRIWHILPKDILEAEEINTQWVVLLPRVLLAKTALNWLTLSPLFDLALTFCQSQNRKGKFLHRLNAHTEHWIQLLIENTRTLSELQIKSSPLLLSKAQIKQGVRIFLLTHQHRGRWRSKTEAPLRTTTFAVVTRWLSWPTFHCAVTFEVEDLIEKKKKKSINWSLSVFTTKF